MKRIVLFINFLTFLQINSFSQPFESIFGDYQTSWNIATEVPDAIFTDSIITIGDSLFGGHNYKVISNEGRYFMNFIREDLSTGQVWIRSRPENIEYMVMDLSLTLKDTFHLNAYGSYDSIAIVDSVYFEDGKKHVRFNYWLEMGRLKEKLTFIEGLGPNAGVFYQIHNRWGNHNQYLLCSSKDDQPYFVNANPFYEGECNLDHFGVGITKRRSNVSWKIYPNPFHESTLLTFDNKNIHDAKLTIFDSKGRLVRTIENIHNNEVLIERQEMSKGLYLFKLQSKNQVLVSGKMTIL